VQGTDALTDPVPPGNSVVAGHAAFWYSLMSPSQRVVLMAMAETDEFAVDAAISPCRVAGGHLDHKPAQRFGGGWPSWWPVGLGPVPGDSTAMSTQ